MEPVILPTRAPVGVVLPHAAVISVPSSWRNSGASKRTASCVNLQHARQQHKEQQRVKHVQVRSPRAMPAQWQLTDSTDALTGGPTPTA